ncbi:MAG: DUF1598 domain-containing protein [Pirellula sp.]
MRPCFPVETFPIRIAIFGASLVLFACFQGISVSVNAQQDQTQDLLRLQSLKEAVLSGGTQKGIEHLRTFPAEKRPRFLSALHQAQRDSRPNGGGAIADYTELMTLIENTIDGDWQSQGGTSSMLPYRNGVRIDPSGVIERFDPNKVTTKSVRLPTSSKSNPASLTNLGEWQEPTTLRWVSLHQLDEQVASRLDAAESSKASIAMEVMGGIYRIDYVAFDPTTDEWFLGGPAGDLFMSPTGDLINSETRLPPVLLEDLLSIAPHVLNGQGELGCTIDPDPKRLAEAYAAAQLPSAIRALQRNPDRWVEQWRQKLGRQQTKVIGLPQNSPAGYALILADAHMKRLGLELEHRPKLVKSYWQEREIFGGSRTDVGLVRWWFSLTDRKIPMDPERKIYHFASSNVQVLSEAQMMNALGSRVVANAPDVAADSFARNFGQHFGQLQREFPCYGRLRHIFDLAVALEIVRVEMQKGNGRAFKALVDSRIQPALETAPMEIDSVASTHKLPDGTVTAIVSGGVSIEFRGLGRRMQIDRLQTNKVDVAISNNASNNDSKKAEHEEKLTSPLSDKPFWR